MMSESSAAFAASPRLAAAIGFLVWGALSACSGAATEQSGLGTAGDTEDAGGPASTDDGGTDGSSTQEVPGSPTYKGKNMNAPTPDASGSIASADGSCPLPDSLSSEGINCPSCAETNCASALSMCDPTMVNACTEYYCASQCLQLGDGGGGGTGNACAEVMQCCPTLLGTPLGLTCIGVQATSAQASCQSMLMQAQAIGRCQ
jgi:hypothetical protein